MKHFGKEIFLDPLYEDNHVLVCKKPSNLVTQKSKHAFISLEEIAKDYIKKKSQKNRVFLHAIHRLDKAASGLVLFAKTSKALSRLNQDLREKKIFRTYRALVAGYLKNKKDYLKHYLMHANYRAKVFLKKEKQTKKALLQYQVLEEKHHLSLLEIELVTGRYHQIRAQLSFIGHPILGDKKYGSAQERKDIMLHGYRLVFLHPVTKKKIVVIDPQDLFQNWFTVS